MTAVLKNNILFENRKRKCLIGLYMFFLYEIFCTPCLPEALHHMFNFAWVITKTIFRCAHLVDVIVHDSNQLHELNSLINHIFFFINLFQGANFHKEKNPITMSTTK